MPTGRRGLTKSPAKPKGDNRHFRACRERQKMSKRVKARDLARLVAVEGRTFREAAADLGVTYNYIVNSLWPMTKELYGPGLDDAAEREAISHFVVAATKRIVTSAEERFNEQEGGAAYGAVALKGLAQLAEWYGVDKALQGDGEAGGILKSIEEIADAVIGCSPALAGRMEHIARIRERQSRLPDPEAIEG